MDSSVSESAIDYWSSTDYSVSEAAIDEMVSAYLKQRADRDARHFAAQRLRVEGYTSLFYEDALLTAEHCAIAVDDCAASPAYHHRFYDFSFEGGSVVAEKQRKLQDVTTSAGGAAQSGSLPVGSDIDQWHSSSSNDDNSSGGSGDGSGGGSGSGDSGGSGGSSGSGKASQGSGSTGTGSASKSNSGTSKSKSSGSKSSSGSNSGSSSHHSSSSGGGGGGSGDSANGTGDDSGKDSGSDGGDDDGTPTGGETADGNGAEAGAVGGGAAAGGDGNDNGNGTTDMAFSSTNTTYSSSSMTSTTTTSSTTTALLADPLFFDFQEPLDRHQLAYLHVSAHWCDLYCKELCLHALLTSTSADDPLVGLPFFQAECSSTCAVDCKRYYAATWNNELSTPDKDKWFAKFMGGRKKIHHLTMDVAAADAPP
ncbi:hypothetical protein JKP88DRAFT_279847 [Tribonema minus]|uniref:Uncharacterized protein n=1 Tax=Tribonema minus TaxID=303371 RepID=A0A836CC00_9STRA|nr:hypothetical protein JKP88DRAFT_279847 [Tribonema minus]